VALGASGGPSRAATAAPTAADDVLAASIVVGGKRRRLSRCPTDRACVRAADNLAVERSNTRSMRLYFRRV